MKIKLLILFMFSSSILFAQEPLIGTHHSLSYINPKWYWIPFNWMVRCQRLDLSEQIECGVTYFDIRVRFKKEKVISGHGIINYDIDVLQELEMLNTHSREEKPLYIRIMYESKPFCKNPTVEEMLVFMDMLKQNYPSLIFTQCHIRNPYTLVETITDVPKKDCYQFYKDYGAKTFLHKLTGLKFPYPEYYAKRNNKKYLDELDKEIFSILDFVERKE